MKPPDLSAPRSRHRLIAALAALVTVLVLAGVGVYGLLAGPPTANE
ncbi:putative small lipoprotein YifL, partial [Arthrobacter tumbae]|nr:putative small lipoprotein YifL [Arthrobacter tumbae]